VAVLADFRGVEDLLAAAVPAEAGKIFLVHSIYLEVITLF
jgi:hypothetical protein